MADMQAMNYEYFIRRAFQKGRFGKPGANADIFRALISEQWEYKSEREAIEKGKPRTSNKPIEKLEASFHKKTDEVKKYVSEAIEYSLKKYNNKLNQIQKDELNNCIHNLDTYEITIISQVIDKADNILLSIGLFPQ